MKNLTTPDGQSFEVTDAQYESFQRVLDRQGLDHYLGAGIDLHVPPGEDSTLFVEFSHILIGIEPDGYAHS